MVAHGDTLTFDVHGQAGQWPRSVDDVRSGVIDGLSPFFDVESVSLTTDSFLTDPLDYFINWRYSAVVRATLRSDYGDVRDVDSIVAHAFYNAAGELPTVTARGLEAGQDDPKKSSGLSIQTTIILAIVALVLVAIIKVE